MNKGGLIGSGSAGEERLGFMEASRGGNRGREEQRHRRGLGDLYGAFLNQDFNPFPITFLSTTRNTTAQTPIPTRRTYCESAEID